jgi:hypothetical protein
MTAHITSSREQASEIFKALDTKGWDGTTDGEVYWVDVRALDKYRSPASR